MKEDLVDRENSEVVYAGKIRSGGAESGFEDGYSVKKDEATGLVFLDPVPEEVKRFYEDPDYWAGRYGDQESIDFDKMYRKLDWEQCRWLTSCGFEIFRGKTVADFGAGAGIFLDVLRGVAAETVAVEPTTVLKSKLESGGHKYYPYSHDVKESSLDVIVSFDTLEHTLRPDEFLGDVWKALKPGGTAIIGVPNNDDFLKELCPNYLSFFYHKSHLFFFDANGLHFLAKNAGFKVAKTEWVHKYDLNNMALWLRDGAPSGRSGCATFDEFAEKQFCANLERTGKASYVMVFLVKESQ